MLPCHNRFRTILVVVPGITDPNSTICKSLTALGVPALGYRTGSAALRSGWMAAPYLGFTITTTSTSFSLVSKYKIRLIGSVDDDADAGAQ